MQKGGSGGGGGSGGSGRAGGAGQSWGTGMKRAFGRRVRFKQFPVGYLLGIKMLLVLQQHVAKADASLWHCAVFTESCHQQ